MRQLPTRNPPAGGTRAAVRVREASLADLPAVLGLEREVFPRSAFARAQVAHLLRSSRSTVYLARGAGKPAGFVAVWWRRGASTCRIVDLAVRVPDRGRGVGQALVRAALRHGRRHRFAGVTLEVAEANRSALNLYRKMGFVLDRRLPHYYARRRHALRLVHWLPVRGRRS